MKARTKSRKGQIFSIDVLFSLLPMMMIIGASLQYLYLAEEDAKIVVQNSRLDTISQGMSGFVMSNAIASGAPYLMPDTCDGLEDAVRDYGTSFLPDGYSFFVKASNYYNLSDALCSGSDPWSAPASLSIYGKDMLDEMNNTAASDMRFTNVFKDDGTIDPGKIAGLSFIVWEDIP